MDFTFVLFFDTVVSRFDEEKVREGGKGQGRNYSRKLFLKSVQELTIRCFAGVFACGI